MKRTTTIITLIVIVSAFSTALIYLWQKNQEDPITYATQLPSNQTIVVKTMATGSIVPKEEILINSTGCIVNKNGILNQPLAPFTVTTNALPKPGGFIAKISNIINKIQNDIRIHFLIKSKLE